MPRKKKNNIDKEVVNKELNEFVYCGLMWNCKDMEV